MAENCFFSSSRRVRDVESSRYLNFLPPPFRFLSLSLFKKTAIIATITNETFHRFGSASLSVANPIVRKNFSFRNIWDQLPRCGSSLLAAGGNKTFRESGPIPWNSEQPSYHRDNLCSLLSRLNSKPIHPASIFVSDVFSNPIPIFLLRSVTAVFSSPSPDLPVFIVSRIPSLN